MTITDFERARLANELEALTAWLAVSTLIGMVTVAPAADPPAATVAVLTIDSITVTGDDEQRNWFAEKLDYLSGGAVALELESGLIVIQDWRSLVPRWRQQAAQVVFARDHVPCAFDVVDLGIARNVQLWINFANFLAATEHRKTELDRERKDPVCPGTLTIADSPAGVEWIIGDCAACGTRSFPQDRCSTPLTQTIDAADIDLLVPALDARLDEAWSTGRYCEHSKFLFDALRQELVSKMLVHIFVHELEENYQARLLRWVYPAAAVYSAAHPRGECFIPREPPRYSGRTGLQASTARAPAGPLITAWGTWPGTATTSPASTVTLRSSNSNTSAPSSTSVICSLS